MKFTGYGIIMNPHTVKKIVDFNKTREYETEDAKEIEILQACPQARAVGEIPKKEDEPVIMEEEPQEHGEPIKLEKDDIIDILEQRGVKYDKRWGAKKLEALLYKE